MSTVVSNFNEFMTTMQIKRKYISRKSGIEGNKLSRILTGKQSVSETDMEVLSKATRKSMQYFLKQNFNLNAGYFPSSGRIAFYASSPTEKQAEIAGCRQPRRVADWHLHIHAVAPAGGTFMQIYGLYR